MIFRDIGEALGAWLIREGGDTMDKIGAKLE